MPGPRINPVQMVEVDGPYNTYCGVFTNLNAGTLATTAILTLAAAANKVVRVVQVCIAGTAAVAGAHFDVVLATYKGVAVSGGTPVGVTAVPQDSGDPAAGSVCQAYTAAPTLPTLVGSSASAKIFCPVAGSALNVGQQFNFGFGAGSKALTLRAADLVNNNSIMAITLNGATPANVTSLDGFVIWTESDF